MLRAHPDRCREYAVQSIGRAATYNDELGFMGAAELADQALESGRTAETLIAERGLEPKPIS